MDFLMTATFSVADDSAMSLRSLRQRNRAMLGCRCVYRSEKRLLDLVTAFSGLR